jgi:hypothetical protein
MPLMLSRLRLVALKTASGVPQCWMSFLAVISPTLGTACKAIAYNNWVEFIWGDFNVNI